MYTSLTALLVAVIDKHQPIQLTAVSLGYRERTGKVSAGRAVSPYTPS